ncbi:hypothetical protein Riv7116_4585 [Rivularia sp. PCC 7116]|uniref:hypothetical protein n=1 Tax=Rivularia sp. PCC 7116 TaxID=373994 RepID=UPI00029F11EE|nr:hypothetical protein [Rivularia sp. PCC 7116]AFY57004.1 hypothetical protein Riv7116_4585 [Rivularia sp. PCC 7116]
MSGQNKKAIASNNTVKQQENNQVKKDKEMVSKFKKVILKTGALGIAFGAICSSMVSPAYAGWGIKDLDITNKNSGIRKTGREIDQRRLDAGAYQFYLNNNCPAYLNVKLEYIPRNSSKWKTRNYTFKPGERSYLVPTRNAIVYVSARSSNKSARKFTWSRKKINMGRSFLKYTYTLNCRRR